MYITHHYSYIVNSTKLSWLWQYGYVYVISTCNYYRKLMYSMIRILAIADIMERCIMCGAGDDSLDHPEYSDRVSSDITCTY